MRQVAACLLLAACALELLGQAQAPRRTQVVLLGAGTPNADPDRSGPSVAVVVNNVPYLVDFGPGVVRRAEAARRKGVAGLAVPNLRRAFVTHLHSDHTAGYPDLILTPWVLGRKEALEVYGPPGLKHMTDHIVMAFRDDILVRLDGSEPANETGFQVEAREIEPGEVYKDENVVVTAFPVKHGSWPHAFGYRFKTPDRSIVISGDTTPAQTVIDACQGCDILIHEVYSVAGFAKREPAWQKYHAEFHTSSRDLAELASKAKPGLLVLYHQLLWTSTEEELLAEIRRAYKGKVVSGRDLDIY
jgi:ribonuclease Z